MKTEETQTNKKNVYITAGTKGGVGKSTAAIYFSNTIEKIGEHSFNIDCDNVNPTFQRFLKSKVKLVDIYGQYGFDNLIFEIDERNYKNFVIDMKAGTRNETLESVEKIPFEEMKSEGIQFFLLGCITVDPDSVQTFLNWTNLLRDRVKYIIVFNEKDGKDFNMFQGPFQKFRRMASPGEVVIPKLYEVYNNVLNIKDLTLCDYLEDIKRIDHPAFKGRMPLSRLRRYYNELTKEIEEVIKDER